MRAKRSLGQHFLVDGNLQRKIVETLAAEADDDVLEIGPGREALTRHLVGRPRRLVLVELDDDMAAALEERYGDRDDVTVVHGDVLETDLAALVSDPGALKVVGNIPYNITAPIVFRLLERPRPAEILLMVQKEVAERITADPGTKAYGALSVGVRSVADARLLFGVPRTAFRPVPNVDSAVLRIRPHRPPPLTEKEEETLRRLTRVAFQWRRKQFQKTLRDHPETGLHRDQLRAVEKETGFDLRRRPETFSPEEFVLLSRTIPGI